MEMVKDWPVNCGAPLDPEKVKAGYTWSMKREQWERPRDHGAQVTRAPKEWWLLFGAPQDVGA